MSDKDPKADFNPAKIWRDWVVENERAWSEAMTTFMKKDDVSQAMSEEIKAAVYGQQMMAQGLAGPMAMMNMPTREDIVALSDRIGKLEDAVAQIEAMLTVKQAEKSTSRPRTKAPPSSSKSK